MSIAGDVKEFDKKLHDGLLHKNRLYLRGEKLLKYFHGIVVEDIIDSLEAQGVLETGKENRTKQISSLSGRRFYVIPLDHF